MRNFLQIALSTFLLGTTALAVAATPDDKKQKFKWSSSYAGPVTGSSIFKFLDEDLGVVCYVMQPDDVTYRLGSGMEYAGNSVGAISCVKLPAPNSTPPSNQRK